ncbi:catalase [Clostridium sp. MSJ-4]|uniref:catalase n=1 Tax=Clostridium simiarum TaxID=2841506 RepID=A0ABS6F0K5_9CLOT|nr:catalase [Clostridium simiarum]
MKEFKKEYLTTNQGEPVNDDQNSLTVGERGSTLLQDIVFLEKLAHFDRERIPERVVHAKGAGAHGYFKVYKSMAPYTKAKFLQDPSKETPVFIRFSVVIGSKGVADTVRDVRGFAVKFYTEEGNYDIVGNNLPVFFIRDAIQFPDLIHALKPDPVSNIPGDSSQNPRFWDFMSLTPEATHMLTWLFSDLGTIKSYRFMQGFGVNTYKWVNKDGKAMLIKYHWKPVLGVQSIDSKESKRLAGLDPDIASRDLFNTLACGNTVEYELLVQMMDLEDENKQCFDPLDATKTWPEDQFPLIPVGRMVLNKNPENFFAEVEQSAFCPAAIVPGIEFSNDKLLQGRIFSYGDTQRYRLGANYLELPINRPKVPVNNNQQDGFMQFTPNRGSINYSPNTLGCGMPEPAPENGVPYTPFVEGKIERKKISKTDDYTQAGDRYRSMSKIDKDHLISNIVESLCYAEKHTQKKMIEHFMSADKELGSRIAKGLGF